MAARKKDTVLSAAQSDDGRRALVALRDGLAEAFDRADVNLKPQISGQLVKVLAEIQALTPAGKKATTVDEIRARREARRGATPEGATATGAGKQRRPGGH